jgi:hypothetical protein
MSLAFLYLDDEAAPLGAPGHGPAHSGPPGHSGGWGPVSERLGGRPA